MFFHHRQTQPRLIGNFLIALSIAGEARDLLLAPGQLGQVRQLVCVGPMAASGRLRQFFALDQKIRPRDSERADLSEVQIRAQVPQFRMMHRGLAG